MVGGLVAGFADDKDIVIFGNPFCKYCRKAKELLERINHPSWTYINLDDQSPELEDYLKLETGQRTIPLIYVKQVNKDTTNLSEIKDHYRFLGGYETLRSSIVL